MRPSNCPDNQISLIQSKVSTLDFSENFWLGMESIVDEECSKCVKIFIFHFKCVYFGQKLSENFVFRTIYVRKYDMNVQLKSDFLQRIALCLTKMSDNNNNIHFSGVRFI